MEQLDCDRKNDKRMLWSWNDNSLGSKYRHLCNGNHQCVVSNNNNARLIGQTHTAEETQMFNFTDSLVHPGFYLIKNEYGKCISVYGNTNQTRAEILTADCKSSEAGQNWKWHHY